MIFPAVTPPPPAYVVTATGARRLAQSSYCWQTTCADFIPSRCGDGRTPAVHVRRGDVVRFRLGFKATEVSLRIGGSAAGFVRLAPRPPIRWRVARGGLTILFARAASGGDASYAACFKVP